jgi:signal transduction histidine kinase
MLPRRTLRTQLTMLYAIPFFVSGTILLAIPVLQTRQTRAVPASAGGPGPGSGSGGGHADAYLNQVIAASALALAAMLAVSVVLGWLIAGRFLRPLRTITATARDISASNLHRRLGRTGHNDEFRQLAETLDDLFERLEASFASERHFVANASHELRTPLTAERTLLQVALADPDASVDTLRTTCREVLALGSAQERLIDSLLTLASSEQGVEQREIFDLAAITRDVVLARGEEAQRRDIHVQTALAAAPATGDPSLVASLVANLVDNAIRHNTPGGRVEITTGTADGGACVAVLNTGTPIPPDEVEQLFQPFYRLGGERIRRRDGHGLGLAIVRAIARAHGATVVPRARPGGGLAVEVIFP